MQNPLTSIREEDREKINKMLQLNGSLTYNITKDLTYRGSIGLYRRTLEDNIFYKEFSRQALRDGAPYGEIKKSNYENLTFSNTLTYAPKLTEGHDLSVMLGQEQTDRKTNTFNVTIKNFPNENFGLDDTSLGANSTIPKTNVFSNKYLSFFGRVSYDLYQKYLFTATLRADGYSAFGKDNKWGYFPSLSTAWRASEEKFIKDLNVFSDLKVRVGYGTSGNKSIPEYLSLFKMSSNWQSENGQSKPSFSSSQISNPALKWETDRTTNIGVDMGFFGHRLQATADFYINEAHDLLLKKNMPLLSGYSDMMQNIGKTRNSGVEFAITSYNIDNKNFKWNTSFNIAFNKNKVVKLTNVDHYLYVSGWASSSEFNGADYLIKEGEPMGQMYGYELEGVYTVADFDFDPNTNTYTPIAGLVYDKSNVPQPGSWKYRDDDGDNEITTKDRKVIGNANPDFYGGITNTFSYKDFDFSFILTYQVGNDVYNANKMYFTKMNNRYRNSLEDAANRFTYIDEKGQNVFNNPTELARINEGKSWASINGSSNLVFHSAYVEDGSYLRLSNITLGYSLPKKLLRKASINNLRVYASANNLFTIAGYSGFDPEVSTKPNSGQTPGIDWGAYPRAFSAIFGINLSF